MPIDGLPGGDFNGCVSKMRGEVDDPRAFCAWKIHELTGKWPAQESIHETVGAITSQLREAPDGAPYALVDGVMLVEGVSMNGNKYTVDAFESFMDMWAGKPMRVNHPSRSEQSDRPEGNVYDQIGVLPGRDGFSVDTIKEGEHAGKKAIFFRDARLSTSPADVWVRDRLEAGIIGALSVNGGGEGFRESDGVFTVVRATKAISLDLVTAASAGGQVLMESNQEDDMTEDEVRKLVGTAIAEAIQKNNGGTPASALSFRQLVEASVAKIREAEDEEKKKEETMTEAQPIDVLSEEEQVMWLDTFNGCMGESSDELLCTNHAWATILAKAKGGGEQPTTPAEGEQAPATEAPVSEARIKALIAEAVRAVPFRVHNPPSGTPSGSAPGDATMSIEDMEKSIRESVGESDAKLYAPRVS